jgi:uncharacterized protein YdbL (DUF1318 family)
MLSYIDASGATVNVDAAVNDATGQIGKVESGSYDATVKTDANTSKAVSDINSAAKANYEGTIKVGADTSQANRAVTDVMSMISRLTGAITVTANDQATGTIQRIAGGYYSATIVVKADTSQYMASFNSLPTSKTITQQVVTVPAPAAPAGLMAGVSTLGRSAGPSAGPRATATQTAAPVTINISGAIDPDSTARQIQQLLRTRTRRNMGIELRGWDQV